MQFSLGSGDYQMNFNSYNDSYDFHCYPTYSEEMTYRHIRYVFCNRLHKILSNKIFGEQVYDGREFQSILFTNMSNIGKVPGILDYSPAMRSGYRKEPHNETISRAVLGFESMQKLLKFGKTLIWTDNIYYKYTDEELLHYFRKLILKIDISPIPVSVVPIPVSVVPIPVLVVPVSVVPIPVSIVSVSDQNEMRKNALLAAERRGTIKKNGLVANAVKNFTRNYYQEREEIHRREIIDGWRN